MNLLKILAALAISLTLVAQAGCVATPISQSSGEFVDDSVITAKVKTAIFEEPSLKSAQINVETFKGVVQLSGAVSSFASLSKAGEVARSIRGVTLVNNDLRVRSR